MSGVPVRCTGCAVGIKGAKNAMIAPEGRAAFLPHGSWTAVVAGIISGSFRKRPFKSYFTLVNICTLPVVDVVLLRGWGGYQHPAAFCF